MNQQIATEIQATRRFARMSVRSKQHYLVLQQQAGQNPNKTPETVAAEIQKRILAGKTNAAGRIDLTDLDMRGVDASKLNLDKCDLGGTTMDDKTRIGRAVGANFGGCAIEGTHFLGPINGANFADSRMKHCEASDINASGCNFSGSTQFSNNFAGSELAGSKWIKANAANNSYEKAGLAGSLFERGEQTQCIFDGANMQGAKVLNTGLERASLDRINGTQMELRPAARDEDFSICGAHLERAKLNLIAAAAAERDNATVKDCKIVHDIEEAEAPVRKNPFDALNEAHREAIQSKSPVMRPQLPTRLRPAATLLSLALAA